MHSYSARLTAPVTVAEIELADTPSVNHISVAKSDYDEIRQALVLVRLHAQPLTTIIVETRGGIVDVETCATAAWATLRADPHDCPPLRSLQQWSTTPVRAEAGAIRGSPGASIAKASTPPITVVVATRERPESLAACLDSLARVEYPNFEVLIVDNDPVTDNTVKLVQQCANSNFHYVQEGQRGLAAAHNCGLQVANGKIVAFTDDDVIVDRHWLTEIAAAFETDTDVACVTGLILAAELQTPAQVLLEAHGHFSKGFEQRVVDLGTNRPVDPLFPFTAGRFGSGANMSFDRDKLRDLGGFDPAIGTGTVARGGDDLAAFFAVIASGLRLVYQPSALVWHHHRRNFDSLVRQAYGYGVGLGAYLISALTSHPSFIGRALYRTPAGLSYAFRANSSRNAHLRGVWPRELSRLEWQGLAFAPIAYGIGRWRTRGVRRPSTDRPSIQLPLGAIDGAQ